MTHKMHLYPAPFAQIKRGKKKREYRLYDEKRQKLRVGDRIVFSKLPEKKEEVAVTITSLTRFATFSACYKAYFAEDFAQAYADVAAVTADTYENYYTPDAEARYGALVIGIKLEETIDA